MRARFAIVGLLVTACGGSEESGTPQGASSSGSGALRFVDGTADSGVDFVQGHFIEPPVALGNATTGTFRILK